MTDYLNPIKKIGLAKEVESPENPGGLERRVALIPNDVKKLVDAGCEVSVEEGAGEGVCFKDEEYLAAGARLEAHHRIYSGKDMIIKFKGPPLEAVSRMQPGTVLFCMAHFRSFPERARMLEEHRINVIAMEEILESPKRVPDSIILSKRFVEESLQKVGGDPAELHLYFIGYNDRIVGGIRRAGNRNSRSLTLLQADARPEELPEPDRRTVYFIDTAAFEYSPGLLEFVRSKGAWIFDLREFEEYRGREAVEEYRRTHPPYEFGLRRIQCLHETGRAGARYGFRLVTEFSGRNAHPSDVKPVVLGYGNVGMGAIHECYLQGARKITVLGRVNTVKGRIEKFLKNADVIVNGAEQPPELRGKNFLITKDHIGAVIQPGAAVIDLIGGSPSNRSPVESVVSCTFLTDPYFVENGVYISALWGWPMMGMMKETAVRYSSQIAEVLLGQERLIEGIAELPKGVRRALVCGPFPRVA